MEVSKNSGRMRTFVRFVFIVCFIAFMYASIHRVAVFFNNFEQSDDMVGSYLLAGAFDITALVLTIAVMFFRRSMPKKVFVGTWTFIIAITAYSTFINWEYAMHFQSMQLILQATGNTVPVFDTHGVLHYVPEMKPNYLLLYINPIIASIYTAFSLVYSIVAEFFGAKPPDVTELDKRITYLTEIAPKEAKIRELEDQAKGKGFIENARDAAKKAIEAGREVAGELTKRGEEGEEVANEEAPDDGEESKLDLCLGFINNNPLCSDQMLMDFLQCDIISARRWKARALEILDEQKAAAVEQQPDEHDTEELVMRGENVTSFPVKPKRGRKSNAEKQAEIERQKSFAQS